MLKLRFSEGSGLGAAAVKFSTWSWCSHVGFLLPNGNVIDATPEHGVSERVLDQGGRVEIYALPYLSGGQRAAAVRFAREQIGKPYDWRGCANFAFHRNWRDRDKWFCSELVAWALERTGAPLLRTDHVERVTPRDLLLSPRLCAFEW